MQNICKCTRQHQIEYTHHKEIGARQKEQTPPVFAQVVNRPSLYKMHKHLYKYSTQIKREILLDTLALTPPLQKNNKSHIQPRLPSTPCIRDTNTFHMHHQPHTTPCLIACRTRTRSLFTLTHLPSALLLFSKTIGLSLCRAHRLEQLQREALACFEGR